MLTDDGAQRDADYDENEYLLADTEHRQKRQSDSLWTRLRKLLVKYSNKRQYYFAVVEAILKLDHEYGLARWLVDPLLVRTLMRCSFLM
jgi:hypothetical protein